MNGFQFNTHELNYPAHKLCVLAVIILFRGCMISLFSMFSIKSMF